MKMLYLTVSESNIFDKHFVPAEYSFNYGRNNYKKRTGYYSVRSLGPIGQQVKVVDWIGY
jgi:hypothetical protein